ncbi:MAG TPA: efflux transporter outer membrane subunit [Steroidobacteraceae bacterium]|nr:efflux transporter outer membrane subunit [Steroidobacteraceae bacterium]
MHTIMRTVNRRARAIERLAVLAAAGALSACTVGPSFKRPTTPAPATYTAPASNPAQASDFAQAIVLGGEPAADWWTVFGSPELDALVRQAVADNHTLAEAKARLAEAQELTRARAGAELPELSLDGGAGRQKYGKEFLGSLFSLPPFSYVAIGATVHYTVDYLGGTARTVEEQRALAQSSASEADAAYLTLTGGVVTQAVIAASAQAEMDTVGELLAEDRRNVELVRTAFENGSVSRVDVVTAQSQLASDETLLPPLRQQLAAARHAIAVLIGRTPADWSPPAITLDALKLPRVLPVRLPSELVHHRPDILAAEARLHAATAAVGIATANLYPRITLTATGGLQALPGEQLFDSSNTAWTLISGVTAPVFNGGRLHAERRAALDELTASAARYQQVVLDSFGQVADLLDALSHDAELLAAQSNALAAAQSSADLARESYAAGNTGVLQVLDAQRQRLTASVGLLKAEGQQRVDTAQLFLALGGGRLPESSRESSR